MGKRGGRLHKWHPVDLMAETLRQLVERSGVNPADLDDVIIGCVLQWDQQHGNLGRHAVLAAGLVQVKDDLLDGLERVGGSDVARELLEAIPAEVLNRGGSLIAAPDTRVIAQAGEGEETLFAELDLGEVAEGLANLDTDGHYSRPDVFELNVDLRPKGGVNCIV